MGRKSKLNRHFVSLCNYMLKFTETFVNLIYFKLTQPDLLPNLNSIRHFYCHTLYIFSKGICLFIKDPHLCLCSLMSSFPVDDITSTFIHLSV